jgi:hypothetical protein
MSGKSLRFSISMLCTVFLVLATSMTSQAFSIERLVVRIFGEPSTGNKTGKRPVSSNGICFLSFYQYGRQEFSNSKPPYNTSNPDINVPVLSQNPFFIWNVSAHKLLVSPKNKSSDTQEISMENVTQIKYEQTLNRGRYYKIRLDSSNSKQGDAFNFYILNDTEATKHNTELERIKKQFESKGEERQALEQAQYLAQNNLFLDVLEKVASIEKPSKEFQEAIAQQAATWIQGKNYLQAMSAVFPIQNPTSTNLKKLRTQLETLPCSFSDSSEAPKPESN